MLDIKVIDCSISTELQELLEFQKALESVMFNMLLIKEVNV